MKTYIYRGGFPIVEKSGVGKAIEHQEKMLNAVEAPRAARWKEATVVHMNTVFPDSVIAAFIAKMQKKKVIYYGHSTMEDFKNSFIGSNLAAWISPVSPQKPVFPFSLSAPHIRGHNVQPLILSRNLSSIPDSFLSVYRTF